MTPTLSVRQLIAALQDVDQDLPVGVLHPNNYDVQAITEVRGPTPDTQAACIIVNYGVSGMVLE